jgi:manganese/iron transport system permease protein/iron/zinc/copper transport system permease protein
MVGVILVVGLLITPAATAYLLSDRLARMMGLAALFGVTSIIGGLYLCVWLDTAGGGAIMVFSTFQFLIVLISAPRYGLLARWVRRRRAVPQHVLEDILGTLIRQAGEPVPIAFMREHVADKGKLRVSLLNMVRDTLVETTDGGYRLTRKGAQEASRILRAHRLWESYLDHIGTPEGEVHARAHILEHIRDQRSMDYLDRLLGHPEHDPHGQKIPPESSDK